MKIKYLKSAPTDRQINFLKILMIFSVLILNSNAKAFFTEVSVSYMQKKTSFDAYNTYSAESTTGSLSFYFMERVALELSYTDGTSVKEERVQNQQQTTVQKTQVAGADLILIFADRKAVFQPYLKGGAAQITRKQTIKIDNALVETLAPDIAVAPSYGIGCRFAITETFGLKMSYDIWKTPIGGGATTDDNAIKVGLSWIF